MPPQRELEADEVGPLDAPTVDLWLPTHPDHPDLPDLRRVARVRAFNDFVADALIALADRLDPA